MLSPDGRRVAFTREVAEGDVDVYEVAIDGGPRRPLVAGPCHQPVLARGGP